MKWRQYGLKSDDGHYTTGWLQLPLDKGVRLTLRDRPDIVWTVIYRGAIELDEKPDIKWRVGGLT